MQSNGRFALVSFFTRKRHERKRFSPRRHYLNEVRMSARRATHSSVPNARLQYHFSRRARVTDIA